MISVSVITICFNNLADLQKTCASAESQAEQPDEHWIINGSTQPEIANWLEQTPQPSYRKWINERDKGIADAFNKGIAKASGNIIHLLNSGDVYASDDVLVTVRSFFSSHPPVQWISGITGMMRAGKPVLVGKPFMKNKLYRGMRNVSHPSWFVKKEVYDRVGKYSNEYKIAMDYDMMCRIADEPYEYVKREMAVFDDSGISNTKYIASLQETRKVYESHFGFSFRMMLWQWRLKLLYYLLQTSLGKWLFTIKKKAGLENM